MSSANPDTDTRVLYLEEIDVETATSLKLRLKLLIDDNGIELEKKESTFVWIPARRQELLSTNKVTVVIKTGHKLAGLSLGSMEEKVYTSGEELAQAFWDSQDPDPSVLRKITFNGHPATILLRLRPSVSSQSVHAAFLHLQDEMKKFKPLMADWVEKQGDTVAKYATIVAQLNPMAQLAVGLVNATFELLKEQNKYDNMVSDLADKVKRILPLVERIDKETRNDGSELLEAVVRRMYDIILDTADFSCRYVSRNALRRTAKSIVSNQDREKITELDGELGKLIEDFDRTVSVEALITVKDSEFMDEDRFLRDRLKPVESGYKLDRCCMSDTRKALLDSTINWALRPVEANDSANLFWLYGIPGVGKSAVANSLCARLHKGNRLGGSFFCRRDDPNLREPKYVLPGFIFELAGVWRPYRKLVIKKLKEDSKLNPDSADHTLFLQLLEGLGKPLPYPFVLVIDALDECGNPRTREGILKILLEATSRLSWLRVIITSREEHDISAFFQSFGTTGRYLSRDLGKDEQADADIKLFAQTQFGMIATRCYLSNWPEKDDIDKIVARAGGLFIYVETLRRLVDEESDPEEGLAEVIRRVSGDKEGALYQLYSSTIESKVGKKREAFQRAMKVIISVAPYRPLNDEAVATLAGLKTAVMKTLVDNLGSLLYRDDNENGAIRVRHLSIIDFLTDSNCHLEFRVDVEQANERVGVACLTTMNRDLKFNICDLETSLVSNGDVKNLAKRVKERVSEALQYSCLHWSSHVYSVSYSTDSQLVRKLAEFFRDARPLYWIEVLSVTGQVVVGTQALRQLLLWAKQSSEDRYIELAKEVLQFLITFNTPITTSVPHIYLSALPFIPVESEMWKTTSTSFKNKLMKVSQGRMKLWPSRPRLWTGHTSFVLSVAYSPDGRHVVSGSHDNTVRVWDAETGQAVGEPWRGHTESVNSVAYSPNGRHVVSSSHDNTILMWDAETGQAVGKPWKGHTGAVLSVAYSPDGYHVVTGSHDRTIRIWDAETGQAAGEPWEGHNSSVTSVAYSPDGRHVVSGSYDNTIQIWDTETGQAVGDPWEGHTSCVTTVAYSPDGLHVISGSWDHTIRMWDVETGQAIGEPWRGQNSSAYSIAYSPDGHHVVSGSHDSTIRMWNAETGQALGERWEAHTSWVTSVAYSPDGRHLVSGSYDNTIRIWDAETGQAVGEPWKGHTEVVNSVAYSPDGRHVVSGSNDSTIRIWDTETGQAIGGPWRGHISFVLCVAYSPDGHHVVSGSNERTIRIWDAETGQAIGETSKRHDASVNSVAYSPDGRHIASGSVDKTIQMWDAETGQAIGEPWKGHSASVNSIAYSPDGRHVVSGSNDDTIRMWDAETGQVAGQRWRTHASSVLSVAYSPDGRYIVSGSYENTIRIWDAETGQAVGEPWDGHTLRVTSVAYSPDNRHVVSGSYDNSIRVWEPNSPNYQHRLTLFPLQLHPLLLSSHNDHLPDSNGWVHHPDGGLLYWVPEDCRNGLTCPAVLTIPIHGPQRPVRLDFINFRYGTSWTDVYEAKK